MKSVLSSCAVAFAVAFAPVAAMVASPGVALAEDYPEFTLVLKNHRFEPATLEVPAGKRVKLIVDNQDATPEEFESTDLRREKIIPGRSKGIVWVGPLPKGTYGFYGEFNQKTAQGKLIAK